MARSITKESILSIIAKSQSKSEQKTERVHPPLYMVNYVVYHQRLSVLRDKAPSLGVSLIQSAVEVGNPS